MAKSNKFKLHGETAYVSLNAERYLVNSFRRVMLSHIETWSLSVTKISDNESLCKDEKLEKRVTLLKLDQERLAKVSPENVRFAIDAKAPQNKYIVVYSGNIKFNSSKLAASAVMNPEVPLLTLAPGQSLRIEGKLVKGTAKSNEAMTAVSLIGFASDPGFKGALKIGLLETMSFRTLMIRACDKLIGFIKGFRSTYKEPSRISTDGTIKRYRSEYDATLLDPLVNTILRLEPKIKFVADLYEHPKIPTYELAISAGGKEEEIIGRALDDMEGRVASIKEWARGLTSSDAKKIIKTWL